MLQFSVLASGSKANSTLVMTDSTRVLVDCGLSAKQTAYRLEMLGVDPAEIEAVVITHEHKDHILGVKAFSQRYKTKVYVSSETFAVTSELKTLIPKQVEFFYSGQQFAIGDLLFEPFSIVHDAADPVAFRIGSGRHTLGVVTDLGQVTTLVRERTRALDAIVLESNHDPEMLQNCHYPWQLKQRISGREGHLSNSDASGLLRELAEADSRLQVAIAAHISENSNTPELALRGFNEVWDNVPSGVKPELVAAVPYAATPLFKL